MPAGTPANDAPLAQVGGARTLQKAYVPTTSTPPPPITGQIYPRKK